MPAPNVLRLIWLQADGRACAGVSIALFRNPVSVIGCIGYTLTISGVFAYSQVRAFSVREPGHASCLADTQTLCCRRSAS